MATVNIRGITVPDISVADEFDAKTPTAADAQRVSSVTLSGAPTALTFDRYQTDVTTSGSGGNEDLTLGAATAYPPGYRKLIKYVAEGAAGDTVRISDASSNLRLANGNNAASASLATVGTWMLIEARGAKWIIIETTGSSA